MVRANFIIFNYLLPVGINVALVSFIIGTMKVKIFRLKMWKLLKELIVIEYLVIARGVFEIVEEIRGNFRSFLEKYDCNFLGKLNFTLSFLEISYGNKK